MNEPICECGHLLGYHVIEMNADGCHAENGIDEPCPCNQFTDARIAALTRPRMVRELPKEEGWYWFQDDEFKEYEVVHAQVYGGNLLVRRFWQEDYHGLDRVVPGCWSATPITPDPAPKEVVHGQN